MPSDCFRADRAATTVNACIWLFSHAPVISEHHRLAEVWLVANLLGVHAALRGGKETYNMQEREGLSREGSYTENRRNRAVQCLQEVTKGRTCSMIDACKHKDCSAPSQAA
jgi:hypothetical protein